MSKTFERIHEQFREEKVVISEYGYEELSEDDILVEDILAGVLDGIAIEDYPDYAKGPCVLILERDSQGESIHAVWGIPKDSESPAVLVTAYRPDPERWSSDFRRRK